MCWECILHIFCMYIADFETSGWKGGMRALCVGSVFYTYFVFILQTSKPQAGRNRLWT